MRFFVFISLFAALLLGITTQNGLLQQKPSTRNIPIFLQNYKRKVKERFKRPENANILFSFITGDKTGISPYTKKSFQKVNLSFLLTPSGIHLSGVLFLFTFFLKKRFKKYARFFILSSSLIFLSFDSIKRLSILRIFFQGKYFSKIRITDEYIFLFSFAVSFISGSFSRSPLGFIYSFIFLGTFFSLKNYSKVILILGLFSTQLILALFIGDKVSLISIPFGLLESFLFTLIFPLLLLFLATFWILPFNWGEPLIRLFVLIVHYTAKNLNGSYTSSSIFLIAFVWAIMLMKHSKTKCVTILLLLLIHTNTAMSPVQFISIK
jgi:hypothetical protein